MSPCRTTARILRMRAGAGAFTLVEMLICVGAVALIAVGLGKLFSSTGDTVKIGKRLSYLNEVAATLENTIRRSVASATRDGPMVIRHKVIAGPAGAGVRLSADDRNPAPPKRRADELSFLANGKFTSGREPQWPGRSPSSSVALMYFGHGMVRDFNDALVTPSLTDDPDGTNSTPAQAWPADFGVSGPNEFAGSWILLRHVTVLQRPQSTENGQLPVVVGGQTIPTGLTTNNWQDSTSQVALQPALPTVFRFDPAHPGEPDRNGWGYENRPVGSPSATAQQLQPAPSNGIWYRPNDNSIGWPQAISGLVDVAAMDPQMIRTRILCTPSRLPFDSNYNPQTPPKMTWTSGTIAGLEAPNNAAHFSKMLMAAMLPGKDSWVFSNSTLAQPDAPLVGTQEFRMICAAKPPDFTGTLDPSPSDRAAGTPYLANTPYRQQDQAMLSASNLVVGCSNFKIEWSFGDVYPRFDNSNTEYTGTDRVGQLIWHGREEASVGGQMGTEPYRGSLAHSSSTSTRFDAYRQRWTRTTGVSASRVLPARLVHWPTTVADSSSAPLADDVPMYSFFGYIDPTFKPQVDATGRQLDPDTVDWSWPRLLRFTVSLTDPVDPTFEQTYQFVVEVPAASTAQ